MGALRFRLAISPDQYLDYYRGVVREVLARGLDGRTVRFPAEHLRPHLTRDGVHGLFELQFDADHRFVALRRLGP